MAGYSRDEITAAVQNLVGNSTRPGRDAFGSRVQTPVFAAYQQNIASVFLLNSDAPYYLFWLTSQRRQVEAQGIVDTINELIDYTSLTARASGRVSDVTLLSAARSALISLEQAVASRSVTFKDISKVPAFRQMDTSLSSFLSKNGPNVRQDGDLVVSPNTARQKLAELVPALRTRILTFIGNVELLTNASTALANLELPASSAIDVISKARVLVESVADSLESADQTAGLDLLRDSVVSLMAAKSAVKLYGNFIAKKSALFVDGTGADYADVDHPANPAKVTADFAGPYAISPGHQYLDAWFDASLTPQVSSVGSLVRVNAETIDLTDVTASFLSNQINVGSVVYFIAGPLMSTRWAVSTASATVLRLTGRAPDSVPATAAYDAWISPSASLALSTTQIPVVQSTRFDVFDFHDADVPSGVAYNRTFKFSVKNNGVVTDGEVLFPVDSAYTVYEVEALIQSEVTAPMNLKVSTAYSVLKYTNRGDISTVALVHRFTPPTPLPSYLLVGDKLFIVDGPDAGVEGTVTGFGPAQAYVEFSLVAPPTAATWVRIEIGIRRAIQLSALDPHQAVLARQEITVPRDAASDEAAATLGIRVGTSYAKPSNAADVAKNLTSLTTLLTGGVEDTELLACFAHTVPGLPNNLVLYRDSATASVVVAGPAIQFAYAGEATVGDKVIFTQAPYIGETWTITVVNDGVLTATGGTAFASTTAVFDIGPDISGYPVGTLLRVVSGINAGDYYVASYNSPLEAVLTSVVPQGLTPTPNSFEFAVSLVEQRLTISSKDTALSSALLVKGSFLPELTSASSKSARYTTQYFKLPKVPNQLRLGDVLEYYDTTYVDVSLARSIVGIEVDAGILKLGTASGEPSSSSYTFLEDVLPPFARLRPKDVNDYALMRNLLDGWLNNSTVKNINTFFQNLVGKLNVILVKTGTTTELATVTAELEALRALFNSDAGTGVLEYLQGYSAPPVPQLDNAVQALREKGMQRAYDVLLLSDLTSFFALTEQSSSYAGAMLDAMRDVAVQDLPIRKQGRNDLGGPSLRTSESTDYENSVDDSDG